MKREYKKLQLFSLDFDVHECLLALSGEQSVAISSVQVEVDPLSDGGIETLDFEDVNFY